MPAALTARRDQSRTFLKTYSFISVYRTFTSILCQCIPALNSWNGQKFWS